MRRRERGFSLIELVVAVALLSLLSGIAISMVRTTAFDVEMAWSQLAADLRTVRARAVSHGDHYRLVVRAPRSYLLQPMRRTPGGQWVIVPQRERTASFPDTVTWVTGNNVHVEFDTRGAAVGLTDAQTFALRPTEGGAFRFVSVWPSGQVLRR